MEGDDRERLVHGAAIGTEDIYKIYAESFASSDHLARIFDEAQALVGNATIATPRM